MLALYRTAVKVTRLRPTSRPARRYETGWGRPRAAPAGPAHQVLAADRPRRPAPRRSGAAAARAGPVPRTTAAAASGLLPDFTGRARDRRLRDSLATAGLRPPWDRMRPRRRRARPRSPCTPPTRWRTDSPMASCSSGPAARPARGRPPALGRLLRDLGVPDCGISRAPRTSGRPLPDADRGQEDADRAGRRPRCRAGPAVAARHRRFGRPRHQPLAPAESPAPRSVELAVASGGPARLSKIVGKRAPRRPGGNGQGRGVVRRAPARHPHRRQQARHHPGWTAGSSAACPAASTSGSANSPWTTRRSAPLSR